ncbi:MAG: lamin tail domain-containing protein [Kiritimatiellia bacterium]
MQFRTHARWIVVFALAAMSARAAFTPVISEFLAANRSGLKDEDGVTSDWIEIQNTGTDAGNLLGWFLTNDAENLNQWTFPSTPLAAGGYVIVFATGKDRAVAGQPLHTSFSLSADGDYLALVQPDGATKATELTPAYPPQSEDVSFGTGAAAVALVGRGTPLRYKIPTAATEDAIWFGTTFDDSLWNNGTTAPEPTVRITEVGTAAADRIEVQNVSGQAVNTTGWKLVFNAALNGTINTVHTYTIALPASLTAQQTASWTEGVSGVPTILWPNGGKGWALLLDAAGAMADFVVWGYTDAEYATFNVNTTVAGTPVVINPAVAPWSGSAVAGGSTSNLHVLRQGVQDHNTAADFIYTSTSSFGATNAGLTLPMTTLPPVQNFFGVGYESAPSDPVNFAAELSTTVPAGTTGIYIRAPFTTANPAGFSPLLLRVKTDDGFIAYLNGTEVARHNAPAAPAWNSTATADRPDSDALTALVYDLTPHAGLLQTGGNVIAVHALNSAAGSPDLLASVELAAVDGNALAGGNFVYFQTPTPGAANGTAVSNAGPLISGVTDGVPRPLETASLVITATVAPKSSPVASVSLVYRIDYGTETTVPMLDNGNTPDAIAGDGVYSATLPASAYGVGDMIRWAVTSTDSAGNASRNPLVLDQATNSQNPFYYGTVAIDPAEPVDPPVWLWFTANVTAARSDAGTRASVMWNGIFYDNIYVRRRGGYTNTNAQKFDFNKGRPLNVNATLPAVGEINLNGPGSDGSYLRQTLGFTFHQVAGNPGCESFWTAMRVNGAADRLGILIEQVNEDYLKRHGLPDSGDLYKFVQRATGTPALSDTTTGIEKKTNNQTDLSTAQALVDALALPTAAERRAYIYDHMDLPEVMNFFGARIVLEHADDVRKNFYLYQDIGGDGLWRIFPWDQDWLFGIVGGHGNAPRHPFFGTQEVPTEDGANQWCKLYDVLFESVEIQRMALRRARTLMDAHLKAPSTPVAESWFNAWITANWPHISTQSGPTVSARDSLIAGIATRRTELYNTYTASIPLFPGVVIPAAQPANAVVNLGAVDFNPVSGNQDEEYVEITNPNTYDVDLSGWVVSGGVAFTFKAGSVLPASSAAYLVRNIAAFRERAASPRGGEGRLLFGPYDGGLGNFAETIELRDPAARLVSTTTYVGDPTAIQQALRITEINFNPYEIRSGETATTKEDFEFVELMNTSSDPLDIGGSQFTAGISGTLASPTLLDAGERVVVVKNSAAFQSRYGAGPRIVGTFGGSLNNGGEPVELRDAAANKVHDFNYSDAWTPRADGNGSSMQVVDPFADYESGVNWTASTSVGGDPGEPPVAPSTRVVVNEVLTHTDPPLSDSVELHNTDAVPVDISGWWLSDNGARPAKFQIPAGTILPPGGYVVFDEGDFNPTPLTPGPNDFSFSSSAGETVLLVETNAAGRLWRFADYADFPAALNGESFGRWRTGVGDLWPMSALSLGAANPGPRVGSLVISELHYNHPGDTNGVMEFVEVFNPAAAPVTLTGWTIGGGIDFAFPAGTVLQPGRPSRWFRTTPPRTPPPTPPSAPRTPSAPRPACSARPPASSTTPARPSPSSAPTSPRRRPRR